MFSRTAARLASSAAAAGPGPREVVIVAAQRTPVGSFMGALSSLPAPALGAAAIRGALAQAGVAPDAVGEVYMGNVCSAGIGQAPAKQAALGAGVPDTVPCTTVHKVCASGLKSVMLGAQAVALGHQDVVVCGGMESMSNIPYYLPKGRGGFGFGHGEVQDGLIADGLWDPYDDQHMGMCAEECADTYGLGREAQDAYAVRSYERAAAAWAGGKFDAEVTPVEVPAKRRGGEPTSFAVDQEYTAVKLDKVGSLRPAFKRDGGTVTAANASTINDGASALVLMSAERAAELGCEPLAKIRGYADAAKRPVEFTTAPAKAVPLACAQAGVDVSDIEYHEVNEAFSVVALANQEILGVADDRINPYGGAVALGHPLGSSGSRILVTLLSVLADKGASLGCASICNGGGGASAVVVERM